MRVNWLELVGTQGLVPAPGRLVRKSQAVRRITCTADGGLLSLYEVCCGQRPIDDRWREIDHSIASFGAYRRATVDVVVDARRAALRDAPDPKPLPDPPTGWQRFRFSETNNQADAAPAAHFAGFDWSGVPACD